MLFRSRTPERWRSRSEAGPTKVQKWSGPADASPICRQVQRQAKQIPGRRMPVRWQTAPKTFAIVRRTIAAAFAAVQSAANHICQWQVEPGEAKPRPIPQQVNVVTPAARSMERPMTKWPSLLFGTGLIVLGCFAFFDIFASTRWGPICAAGRICIYR